MPNNWKDYQKQWPTISWDKNLNTLDFSTLEKEKNLKAEKMYSLIQEIFSLFNGNVEALEDKLIPRTSFSNVAYHNDDNIKERKILVFCDANDKENEGLLGFVAYLRVKYKIGETGWQFLIANSQVAKDGMTIPRRELSAVKFAIKTLPKLEKR